MKAKFLTIALAIFSSSVLFAQETSTSPVLKSKKGETILPEKGDYVLGMDASPFLTYFGGFLSNAGGACPNANFLNNKFAIYGKYFVDEKTAYRGTLRIGINTTSTSHLYDTTTITAPAYLEEVRKTSDKDFVLGFGMEKRRGNTRLQGYYGADILLSIGSSSETYEYAEPVSQSNPFHTNYWGQGAGTTKIKNGTTFGLGLRAFVGAEYFILPKISIGGEFGWGPGITSTGEGTREVEEYSVAQGSTAATVHTETFKTGKNSSFCLDTDNGYGKLALYLHF